MPSKARHLLPALTAVVALGAGLPAAAEKADRNKPMVVEADRPGTLDLQRQVVVFNGNVVIAQGTMQLRAERIEMRETADGYRAAVAIGAPGKPASWRQKRDGLDETVEGVADRIEFDGRADTLRFLGNGHVKRLRGGALADEVSGGTIVWDNTAEVFRVEGGQASATNPGGRVRIVLSPRIEAGGGPVVAPPKADLTPSRDLASEAAAPARRP
jgi:lipopolysaccharide export system protein LptA